MRKSRVRRWGYWLGAAVLLVLGLGGIGQLFLPSLIRDYVNSALDRNLLYSGRIEGVELHIWRGAYSVRNVRISKAGGLVPVPFFSAQRVDFSLDTKALLHGKVVGQVKMKSPEMNFVDDPAEGQTQTGAGAPWLGVIRDLFPFQINSATVENGSLHFRSYKAKAPIDVYVSHLQLSVDNLSNIRDETNPLVARVQLSAQVMDQARCELRMTLDPFSYRPTFHLALRLLGLDLTRINDLALAYGKFDFKRGWFDLVVEADSREGIVTGYVKPLFRDLRIFSLGQDLKEDNALQFFWQALLGATTAVFKNQSRDQFGTLIPFRADAEGATTTDLLAMVGNILRNAFVRAYLPRLQSGKESVDGLEFSAPELEDPLSGGDSP